MPEMKPKVLVVDDAVNLLSSFKRQFRKEYEVATAENGEQGLQVMNSQGPFAVVISDMEMPVMNGAEFLKQARLKSPETVRILLTGQTNIKSAIDAVNEGQIFRFMEKPCSPDLVKQVLKGAVKQYHLHNIEKELMDKTVKGVIGLLVDLLGQLKPQIFNYGLRSKRYIRFLVDKLELKQGWEFEIAAMLSELGAVSLANDTINNHYSGENLTIEEQEQIAKVPVISAKLIEKIPKLENVATMILKQSEFFGLDPRSKQLNRQERNLLGGQMIRLVREFDRLLQMGMASDEAVQQMLDKPMLFNSDLVKLFADYQTGTKQESDKVLLQNISVGMVLDCDIRLKDYTLILAQGFAVTEATLSKIREYKGQIEAEDHPVSVVSTAG